MWRKGVQKEKTRSDNCRATLQGECLLLGFSELTSSLVIAAAY